MISQGAQANALFVGDQPVDSWGLNACCPWSIWMIGMGFS